MISDDILASIKYVSDSSKYVSIDEKVLEGFISNFAMFPSTHWSDIYPLKYKRRKKDEDELDFLFLIGSQAFCFWGYPEKWTITYKGKYLDGWWALVACFERALERNIPILDGQYLANLTLKETKELFEGNPEIPLIKDRNLILKKIGKTLVKKYHGKFSKFYKSFNIREAFSLMDKITQEFSGFNDVFLYKGKTVYFYKKAQVVLSDIYSVFKGKDYGDIKNIDKIPGHADYKIPMILRKLGVLVYSKGLADKIDKRVELKSGSEEEAEIRANMLWVTHLICEKLKPKFPKLNPISLNGILWNMSQKKHKDEKPYHLTKTIYY